MLLVYICRSNLHIFIKLCFNPQIYKVSQMFLTHLTLKVSHILSPIGKSNHYFTQRLVTLFTDFPAFPKWSVYESKSKFVTSNYLYLIKFKQILLDVCGNNLHVFIKLCFKLQIHKVRHILKADCRV